MTADGSEDEKITPEGLPSYQVPPPVDYIPAAEAMPASNQATGEDIDMNNVEDNNEDDDGKDEPDDNGEEWEDHEDDQMKVLYESGWYTGEVKYYN